VSRYLTGYERSAVQFGRYRYMRSVDIDGPCLSLCALQVQAYVNVSASEAALQMAVATAGPVAVAIDASHPEFLFYSSGVFYLAECKNDANDLDHGIALLQSPPPPLNPNPNASRVQRCWPWATVPRTARTTGSSRSTAPSYQLCADDHLSHKPSSQLQLVIARGPLTGERTAMSRWQGTAATTVALLYVPSLSLSALALS
jgi:hypothetical protein